MAQPEDWEECLLAALDTYEHEQAPGTRLFSSLPGFLGLGPGQGQGGCTRFEIQDPVLQAAASLVVFGFNGTEVDAHVRRMLGLGTMLPVHLGSTLLYGEGVL